MLDLHIQNTIRASAKKCRNLLTPQIQAQAHHMYQRALDLDQRIRYVQEYFWRERGIWPKSFHHWKTTWGKWTWLSHGLYGKEKYFGYSYPHYKGRRKWEVGVWYTQPQNAWRCFSTVWGNKDRRMGRWRLIGRRGGAYRTIQRTPHMPGGLQKSWKTYINTTWNRRTSAPEEGTRPHRHTKTPIHNDTNHHESNGWGFWKACNKNWPYINWARVWGNLSAAPVPESTRIDWFRVIHDLIQTNERLQRISMVQTDICRKCTMKDTL